MQRPQGEFDAGDSISAITCHYILFCPWMPQTKPTNLEHEYDCYCPHLPPTSSREGAQAKSRGRSHRQTRGLALATVFYLPSHPIRPGNQEGSWLVVWRSGSVVVGRTNEVNLRRARLPRGWVTAFRQANHLGWERVSKMTYILCRVWDVKPQIRLQLTHYKL